MALYGQSSEWWSSQNNRSRVFKCQIGNVQLSNSNSCDGMMIVSSCSFSPCVRHCASRAVDCLRGYSSREDELLHPALFSGLEETFRYYDADLSFIKNLDPLRGNILFTNDKSIIIAGSRIITCSDRVFRWSEEGRSEWAKTGTDYPHKIPHS